MMMGLGYLGSSSSSSSSSNLSPLAPPFTLGRSNHNKPLVHSNPVTHLNDPSYPLPFTSSSSWPYSNSSTPNHSNDDYGFISPEPNNPTTTHNWSDFNCNGLEQITPPRSHWSAVNPSPKRVAYNLGEAKPFYPPHASNDDIPLVGFTEATCDLLSTSGPLHVDEIQTPQPQVDYTRSLSGLKYNQQQQVVWSRLPEGKPIETGDSFYSEEANIAAASLAYNNYLNQGVRAGYGTDSLSKGKDDPNMLYYADVIRRANNTGLPSVKNGKSDGTSFFANNHHPNELSQGELNFTDFPMFLESHHPLIQSPEEDYWNSQRSFEKKYQTFDCMSKSSSSMVKSSPLVIKPPAAVSAQATASSSISLEIGNLNLSDVVVGSHKSLKEKEEEEEALHHLHPQGLEASGSFFLASPSQLRFEMGRTDEPHTFVAPSSTSTKEGGMPPTTKLSAPASDQLNFDFKAARPSFHVPDINIPNVTESLKAASANSFDHHHHNPAEDSPCWKGAPSSHFLPFGGSPPEAQPPTKKLQTAGNDMDLQIDYSFNPSSLDKKTLGGPTTITTTTTTTIPYEKEHSGHELVDAVGFTSSSEMSGGGTQSLNDTIKLKKGHGYSTSGHANSQTPELDMPNPKEDDDDDAIISPDAMYGEAAKFVDATTLVKALCNLSDLLLCSNDLKEHDYEALNRVIHNLGVCMSRQVQVVSTHKLMLPQQNTSTSDISHEEVMNETTTGGGMLHDNEAGEKSKSDDVFGKNMEKLLEHASLRDPPKVDDTMVQAIKKVLDENLDCEVELPSETLLYKNLWLEAEAELCSLSYRARFERLKREALLKANSSHKSTATDASVAGDRIKDISNCNGVRADSSKVSNAHNIDDVESPVRARFNILKRRGDQNPSCVKNTEEEREAAGIKVTSCGVNVQQQHKEDGEDDESWVMARLNTLKRRGESSIAAAFENLEEKQVRDCDKDRESTLQDGEEEDEAVATAAATAVGSGSDWEHILKDDFSWRLG